MDYICLDEGLRAARFTLATSGREVAALQSVDDVLNFVRDNPNSDYTIYPGERVSLNGPEIAELHERWREWEVRTA